MVLERILCAGGNCKMNINFYANQYYPKSLGVATAVFGANNILISQSYKFSELNGTAAPFPLS